MTPKVREYLIDPLFFLGSIFVGASLTGWATLIWQGKTPAKQKILAGAFLAGVSGVIVAASLWENLIHTNPMLLGAISLASGAGVTGVVDVVAAGVILFLKKRMGVSNGDIPPPSAPGTTILGAAQRPEDEGE